MKIEDTHPEIREALTENGLSLRDRVSPEEALVVWAKYHWSKYRIGDTRWATFLIEQLDIMRAHERIMPTTTPSVAMALMETNGFTMIGDMTASYHWPDTSRPITAQIGSRTWRAVGLDWVEI